VTESLGDLTESIGRFVTDGLDAVVASV